MFQVSWAMAEQVHRRKDGSKRMLPPLTFASEAKVRCECHSKPQAVRTRPMLFQEKRCLRTHFPGGAGDKEPAHQCRRHQRRWFNPWVGKIPGRRAWQPTPVYSCLENPPARGAWWTVVAKRRVRLSDLAHGHGASGQ